MRQRDVKNRIDSIRNIEKITHAMQMVAAARLRRAEQRIVTLRPYARAIRRMTRQAVEAAGGEIGELPILHEHESEQSVAILLVTGDRGLAGPFNSQIIRAGFGAANDYEAEGRQIAFFVSGRRGVSAVTFRGREPRGAYTGFSERPTYANAREIGEDLMTAYIDGEVDRVESFYNRYVSPIRQEVRRETLLPVQQATILDAPEGEQEEGQQEERGDGDRGGREALVEYEPEPELILQRLVPAYVVISVYRALLESTASEYGARMTAMRSASDNAHEAIEDLTLEMNRARQAEITQEILEIVAGSQVPAGGPGG